MLEVVSEGCDGLAAVEYGFEQLWSSPHGRRNITNTTCALALDTAGAGDDEVFAAYKQHGRDTLKYLHLRAFFIIA